jgi:26S proteasome regulatory subunit N1
LVRINTVISSNSIHSNATVLSMSVCPAGCVVAAMKPRMLLTLDGEGQLLSVPVRLGQAVDVVAQAGRPKTITGTLIGLQSIRPA